MTEALRTLRSLRRHGGAPFWTLDVHGDYRLRDFLRAGCDYARRWRLPVTRRFADCPSRIRRFVKIGKIESCHFVINCKTESRHSVSICLTEGENRGRFVRV